MLDEVLAYDVRRTPYALVVLHHSHFRAFGDFAARVRHDEIARRHAGREDHPLAIAQAFGHDGDGDRVALHAIDRALAVAIEHGFARNYGTFGGGRRNAR